MNDGENPTEENEAVETPEVEEASVAAEGAEDFDAAGEDDSPESRIAALEAEVAEANDRALRAMAETENVRRRSQQELTTKLRYAHTDFARDLVSVADNLSRALGSVPAELRKKDEALENLCVGVEMTQKELMTAFEKAGVKPVDPEGKPFDHNLHQAMFEVPNTEVPEGTVVNVVARGYTIHERLLRAAMVGVAKGGPKPDAAATTATDETSAAPGDAAKKQEKASDVYEQAAEAEEHEKHEIDTST
ncbi:MAG: nucleotide exchange factor GrpE [Rhodospirillales bacterium]|nr:nucleotide exchange factor GrpE [Rhodospirillales bacterium]